MGSKHRGQSPRIAYEVFLLDDPYVFQRDGCCYRVPTCRETVPENPDFGAFVGDRLENARRQQNRGDRLVGGRQLL